MRADLPGRGRGGLRERATSIQTTSCRRGGSGSTSRGGRTNCGGSNATGTISRGIGTKFKCSGNKDDKRSDSDILYNPGHNNTGTDESGTAQSHVKTSGSRLKGGWSTKGKALQLLLVYFLQITSAFAQHAHKQQVGIILQLMYVI